MTCQIVALPVWGAVSDRIGRRKAIIYSLVATLVAAAVGYLRLALPQQFIFSVVNGLVTAGLPLAIAFTFDSREQRSGNLARGVVACAFFGGSMLVLGLYSPAVTLLVPIVALILSVLFLPDSLPATSLIGMNAMHGLWHGFSESNRAPYARWWKVFIAGIAIVSGLLVTTFVVADTTKETPILPRPFLVFACAMAACLVIARLVPAGRVPGRTVVLGAGASALVVALVLVFAPAFGALQLAGAALCGAATGGGLTIGILRFCATARQRSAGAELGAISSIWMACFLGGALLALGPFKEYLEPRLIVAAVVALLMLFVGIVASRKHA
ncbi:MAG: MFS transporter [Chthoniobacterales bacterium]|nr:MFS transporter [Chthoniobacterales bacterium]